MNWPYTKSYLSQCRLQNTIFKHGKPLGINNFTKTTGTGFPAVNNMNRTMQSINNSTANSRLHTQGTSRGKSMAISQGRNLHSSGLPDPQVRTTAVSLNKRIGNYQPSPFIDLATSQPPRLLPCARTLKYNKAKRRVI